MPSPGVFIIGSKPRAARVDAGFHIGAVLLVALLPEAGESVEFEFKAIEAGVLRQGPSAVEALTA